MLVKDGFRCQAMYIEPDAESKGQVVVMTCTWLAKTMLIELELIPAIICMENNFLFSKFVAL